MRPDERDVAGLTCSQVMAALSDYADGEAPPALRAQIEAHVAACGQCAAFGGDFMALLAAMRRQLARPDDAPDDLRARVRAAIAD
ncbi:MAG: zf-HC2 domain-containing protein [Vicinamibacterales bacterium]